MNTDKKTLLMVDDSTVYLEMMSVMIGDVYDIKFATDGQKALNLLKHENSVSLILLDLSMPYMNGIEFLSEVKKDSALKDIPVIVLASADDNEAAGLILGAVDYIKKPFPLRNDVLSKIESALNSDPESRRVDLDSYINALFSEYQTVYLIDAQNYSFESISEDENYISLGLKTAGDDFFEAFSKSEELIFEDDRAKLKKAFDRERFMDTMYSKQGITLDYRILVNGEPKHYRLKAMLVPDVNPQVIIGISCMEEEIVGMETLYSFRDDAGNYADIAQSLASDYMCIYYVHLASNRFIEYSSVAEYSKLRLAKSGENFFTFALKSFIEGVNPIDTERVARRFTRENVIKTINEHKAFTISFRLTFEDSDEYVSLKATKLVKDGIEYLVVGISNIDAQLN
ncbi:MAG: response regulator [Eubacterium sp.]|nr:response regulator [Eubacterium sp.]